jgi:hypothetical protein
MSLLLRDIADLILLTFYIIVHMRGRPRHPGIFEPTSSLGHIADDVAGYTPPLRLKDCHGS